MAQKPKHRPKVGPSLEELRARTERALNEGRSQHALELAKQLFKQAPTPPHRELLREYTDRDIHNVTAYLWTLK